MINGGEIEDVDCEGGTGGAVVNSGGVTVDCSS